MTNQKPPDVPGVDNLSEVPKPPGFGHVGSNWVGRANGHYGVLRLIEAGAWDFQEHPGTPWSFKAGDTTQAFAKLPFELDESDSVGTLATLASHLHARQRNGHLFTKEDANLRLLASVVAKLLAQLKVLHQHEVPLRILDPTVVIYRRKSNATVTGLPDVEVYLPDIGFEYTGLPASHDLTPDALRADRRWPATDRAAQGASFLPLWDGRDLFAVNVGLPEKESLEAVARMMTWVMDGKIRSWIPPRIGQSSESKQFWAQPRCDAWRVLEPALQRGGSVQSVTPPQLYDALMRESVAKQFLIELPTAEERRFDWKRLLLPVAVGLSLLTIVGGMYLFQKPLESWLRPIPPPQPIAICPECSPIDSPLYGELGELQTSIETLRDFEAKYIDNRSRLKVDGMKLPPGRSSGSETVQELVFRALEEEYIDRLDHASMLLQSAALHSGDASQATSKGLSEDDQDCLKTIANELQVHLYQTCDRVAYFGRLNASNGRDRWNSIKPKIISIAQRLDDFTALNEKLVRRLNGTFNSEVIYGPR
ncbi:MAG TPA: hypothetical protein DDZ51_04240 [Planctomycetaceae bacterium]|nr:hypothetical protein [Planctomycetaceae bacterium]